MPERWDALVVGAGPAGSTAARVLAEGGLSVLLADKFPFPRRKGCGGALPAAAAPHLPFPFSSVEGAELKEAAFRVSGVPCASRPLYPPLRVVDRAAFDARLASLAVRAGAVFRTARAVRAAESDGGWTVEFAGAPPVRCRWLLCCDGAGSSFSAPFRAGLEFDSVPAVSVTCSLSGSAPPPGTAVLALKYVRDFYAWLFPAPGGRWNYGLAARPASRLSAHARIPARLGASAPLPGAEVRFAPLRLFRPSAAPLGRGAAFLCGEAAALVDPLLGEGIRYALHSGRLAAETALSGGDAVSYTRAVDAEIRSDLAFAWRAAARYRSVPAPFLLSMLALPSGRKFLTLMASLLAGEISYETLHRRYRDE